MEPSEHGFRSFEILSKEQLQTSDIKRFAQQPLIRPKEVWRPPPPPFPPPYPTPTQPLTNP